MKSISFKSGDSYGRNTSCYNCGKKFIDSLQDKSKLDRQKDISTGSVVCTCGQRIAYILNVG